MKLEHRYKQLAAAGVCVVLVYFALYRLGDIIEAAGQVYSVLKPFVYGAVLAFVINVPMKKIEALLEKAGMKRYRRGAAYLLTLAVFAAAVYLFFMIVLPQLIRTVGSLVQKLELFYRSLPSIIRDNEENLGFLREYLASLDIDWREVSRRLTDGLHTFVMSAIGTTTGFLGSFVSVITDGVLAFIFSVYLVMGKEKIGHAASDCVLALTDPDTRQRIFYIARLCNRTFSGFLSGQCLEAVILGVMFVIAMTVFGFPYAVLVGTVIAVTALIPIFGAFIGAGVGIFLIGIDDPLQAVWFLIMFLVIQQIENNLIYPHVVGGSVGLPSLLVFMSVIIGGSLMGVWGMLLFIPSASVLYTLAKEYIARKLAREPERFPDDIARQK